MKRIRNESTAAGFGKGDAPAKAALERNESKTNDIFDFGTNGERTWGICWKDCILLLKCCPGAKENDVQLRRFEGSTGRKKRLSHAWGILRKSNIIKFYLPKSIGGKDG